MAKLIIYKNDESNSIIFNSATDRLVSKIFDDTFTINVPNSVYTYTYTNNLITANRTLMHLQIVNSGSDYDFVNVAHPYEVIATNNGSIAIKVKYYSTKASKTCQFRIIGYRT